jgi:hypothetical protein
MVLYLAVLGVVFGGCFGLFMAALLGAAKQGDKMMTTVYRDA